MIRPEDILAIKDLSLAARRTIDGFMSGINKSSVKGAGLEFSQYRSYQPGDDLRWLDWKRLARTDRYYIRESEMETSISVRLLVDASKSMDHRDGDFTKMDYARHLAAALAWLAHSQGDAVGLYVFREGQVFPLPARRDPQHLARLFYQLEGLSAEGTLGDAISYKHIFLGEQKRELLIFITDHYERSGEIGRLLELLAALRHEIIVFHVLAGNELSLDLGGYSQVEDLETGERVPVGTSGREEYAARLGAWLAAVRMRCLDLQIDYQLMRMDEPMDAGLRKYLKSRMGAGLI
ncbi:DUF58 domain-containing protein [Puia sp.]|jgi:uncharacterized protein (DUF58 family)|uniref:DUF58 domain-containing protein n=1 Tax=Puia sp. TaxID=2045100 RepID=UPI002F3F0D16